MIDLQPDLELSTDEAERVLDVWLGAPTNCSRVEPLKGGLVNAVFGLEFDRPPFRAVVKIHGIDGDASGHHRPVPGRSLRCSATVFSALTAPGCAVSFRIG